MKVWQRKEDRRLANGAQGSPSELPELRMHADDAQNFLRLATTLKIILSRSITDADLNRAEQLMSDYLKTYQQVR